MHIFFIDIDGVIRPNAVPNDYQPKEECLRALLNAVDSINGKIVVTSTWKLAFSSAKFRTIFGKNRFLGCTSDINENSPFYRYQEIKNYLSENKAQITGFTIVDDRPDLFPKGTEGLFICDGDVGFTDQDAYRLISTIAKQNPQPNPEKSMAKNTQDLEEKVTVTFQLSRRQLNRLTHVMNANTYELATMRACFQQIAKYESGIPELDEQPYNDNTPIE